MKIVFVLNGVVVSHSTSYIQGVSISSNIADAVRYEVPDDSPVDIGWELVSTGDYPVFQKSATVTYPVLTPMEFYLAFLPAERIALKTSTDPIVKELWATYELSVSAGAKIDMSLKSNRDSIAYLAIPASATPPGPGIVAPDRVDLILRGVAQ